MSKTVGMGAKPERAKPIPTEEGSKSSQTEMEKLFKKKKKVPEANKILKKEQEVPKKEVSHVRPDTGDQPENKE